MFCADWKKENNNKKFFFLGGETSWAPLFPFCEHAVKHRKVNTTKWQLFQKHPSPPFPSFMAPLLTERLKSCQLVSLCHHTCRSPLCSKCSMQQARWQFSSCFNWHNRNKWLFQDSKGEGLCVCHKFLPENYCDVCDSPEGYH